MTLKNKAAMLFLLLLVSAIYSVGINGGFLFDDFNNLVNNEHFKSPKPTIESVLSAISTNQSGPLGRPIAMLSFWLNAIAQDGLDPVALKATNIAIHIINTVLVFFFTSEILTKLSPISTEKLDNQWTAILISGFWALHPIQLTSILYIVQRMTSLSSTFILIGVISYLKFRSSLTSQTKTKWIIVFFLSLLLAVMTKESGANLLLYAATCELLIFIYLKDAKRAKIIYITLLLSTIAAISFTMLVEPPTILRGYIFRDFSLQERILTEPRVLLHYISLILAPAAQKFSLYHDTIEISRSIIAPMTTLPSYIAIFLFASLPIILRARYIYISFGIAWFLVSHLLESTIIGLELMHEHRNYLALFGFAIMLRQLFGWLSKFTSQKFSKAIPISLILLVTIVTYSRCLNWSTPELTALTNIEHNEDSVRGNYEAGRIYAVLGDETPHLSEHYYAKAEHYFSKSAEQVNHDGSGLFGLYHLYASQNKDYGEAHKKLIAYLRTCKITPVISTWVSNIYRIYENNHYAYKKDDLKEIIQTSINNPTADGLVLSSLLSTASLFTFNEYQNYQGALSLAIEAYNVSPTVSAKLNIIDLHVAAGDTNIANKLLTEIEATSSKINHKARIEYLRNSISKAASFKEVNP